MSSLIVTIIYSTNNSGSNIEKSLIVDEINAELFQFQIFSLTDIPPFDQVLLLNGQRCLPIHAMKHGARIHVLTTAQAQAQTSQFSQPQQVPARVFNNIEIKTSGQRQMHARILNHVNAARQYQRKDWLDKALAILPIEQLQHQATVYREQVQSAVTEDTIDRLPGFLKRLARAGTDLTEREYLVISLAKWFKKDFFTWVNQAPCSVCDCKTTNAGMTQASVAEKMAGAGRVELYRCTGQPRKTGVTKNTQPRVGCQVLTRFPRYNNAKTLCDTRRGRCGEQAQLFHLFLCALGFESRLAYDWTDHVW